MFRVEREGEWIRVVDPTDGGIPVLEFKSDSYFIRDGKPVKASTLGDEELLAELVRTGKLKA
jgi:hypothetical protein